MTQPQIRVVLNTNPQPKTAVLNCSHCRLPHDVEQYIHDKYVEQAKAYGAPVDEIWWCGRCYLAYMGLDGQMRCDCPEHEVPPFPPKQEKTDG